MADTAEKPQEEVPVNPKEATEEKPAPAAEEPEEAENGAKEHANGELGKLERSIIRQVEYYFSDANLHRDKFLLAEIAKDEEGWVPLSVLLTFNRLSSLSADPAVIVDALTKSEEGLLEISDDHQKVRRHPERPIPEHTDERRKELMTRTAYAKGFPLEIKMNELLDFFLPYEKVEHITMRKYMDTPTKTYKFKGSVFVTFETKEQTKDFIDKEKVVFQERELVRKWQEQYLEEKQEERKQKAAKKSNKKQKAEENKIDLPAGAVLFFDGTADDVTREVLREAMEKIDADVEIAYIDYSKGSKEGHVRFQGENTAAKFLEKCPENKLKLNDEVQITLRSLTEEEEKAYLEKAVESMRNRRNNFNKRDKKGHHGHHHGHGRKRRSGGGGEETSDKKKKVE